MLPCQVAAKLFLYADDILLTKPISSEHDISLFQSDIDAISQWLTSHRLSPNVRKSYLLPISRSKSAIAISVSLNGQLLEPCASVKYLGVTITSDLSWGTHIFSVCKKANRQLGLLHRKLGSAPPSVRDKVYRTSILPTLEYCSAVWSPHCKIHIQALEHVETFAARVVTHNWKMDRSSLLLLSSGPLLNPAVRLSLLKFVLIL